VDLEYNVGDRLKSTWSGGGLVDGEVYIVLTSDFVNQIATLRSRSGEKVEGSFTWSWLARSTKKVQVR
jgi:hypothetical protein